MNYTHLGRTGLKVSRLCLGTMNFGDVTDEKTSARILDEALEAGINFIDTADVYGTEQSPDIQQGSGLSEEIIGRWLQQGGRRERIVLATKVYQPMGPGPNDRRLSAYHIRKACEDSLRRLNTDHIDVYQMHHIDRHTPWEEIWQAMELLVQQGKVLYIGSSNFAGWDIATAQSVATARHFLGLVAEQSLYNLTARTIELEVIPACRHFGLGLIPWSPLAGGLLGGVLKKMASGRRARPAFARLIEQYRPTLFFPVKQVVLRLHRDKSGPTVTLSGMLHFCKAPGFHRRCADITRFSCFNDVMQSLHGLFNRRGVVKAMNLKEIHIIHA